MRKLLLMLVALFSVLPMVAELKTATISLNKTTMPSGYSDDLFTISVAKANGGTAPNVSGYADHIRLYAKNTLTIKSTVKMVCAEFTTASSDGNFLTNPKVSIGTFAGKKWTAPDGGADEFTLTNSTTATKGHTRINSVTITYESLDDGKTPVETMEWRPSSESFTLGSAYTSPTLFMEPAAAKGEVVYSIVNEGSNATIDNDGVVNPGTSAGTAIVTAKIENSATYANKTATYTLTVIDPNQLDPDVLTPSFFGCSGSGYKTSAEKNTTYASYFFVGSGTGWNTGNDNGKYSGIVANAKDGYVAKSVTIESDYAKDLDVYVNTQKYTATSNLFNQNAAIQGTKVGSLTETSVSYNFQNGVKHFGVRPTSSGYVTFVKVTIVWGVEQEKEPVAPTSIIFSPESGKTFTIGTDAVVYASVGAEATDCKLYYSLDGVATTASTEYDATTGIVFATDEIGKEYNISVLAKNEAGECTGSATYTIVDKKHVAPTAIVIKENEGNYEAGAELTVSLAADAKAYPAPELFYTIDGRAANDGKATPYTEPFTLVEREGHKTVTVNAYAVNDAGDCVASAMYIFGANKVDAGDPNKWSLVTNVAQLNDGDEVLIVSNKYGKALSTNQKGNNRGNTSVTLNETKDEISTVTGDAQVIVLNNTADGWTLKTNNYTDKDGNAVESGYLFTLGTSGSYLRTNAELYEVPETEGAASSHAEISIMSNGAATIAFKTVGDSNKYLNYNNNSGSGLFSCYRPDYGTPTSPNYSATSQYDAPHFYKKGGFRYEDVEEFYLVMPVNEYTGRHEVYPFVYKGVENGEHLYEVSVSYIGGEFYVRDGRANNSGTYFGSSVEQDAQTASALRANVANNVVPIVSEKSEYTLIHKPAADTHTMFTTHVGEESNAIENATFTMVYTPGSHTDGKLRVKALVLTGIENVGADVEGAVEYFNLQGMRISEPVKGQVVIRRQGAKVEKIAVR